MLLKCAHISSHAFHVAPPTMATGLLPLQISLIPLLPHSSTFKSSCERLGGPRYSRILSPLKVHSLDSIRKAPLPCNGTYSQVSKVWPWTSLECHYATTSTFADSLVSLFLSFSPRHLGCLFMLGLNWNTTPRPLTSGFLNDYWEPI